MLARLAYFLADSSFKALSSSSLLFIFGTSSNLCSRSCFSSCRANLLSASSSVLGSVYDQEREDSKGVVRKAMASKAVGSTYKTYPPIPSYWRTMAWYFHSDGRWETVISVMPRAGVRPSQLRLAAGTRLTRRVVVHHFLNLKCDCRCALIEDGVLTSVVSSAERGHSAEAPPSACGRTT